MLNSYLSGKVKLKIRYNTYVLHYYSRIYILHIDTSIIAKILSKILLWPLLVLTLQWLVHNWCFGSSDSLLPYYYIIHTRIARQRRNQWRFFGEYIAKKSVWWCKKTRPPSPFHPPCSNHNFHPLAVIPKRAAKVALTSCHPSFLVIICI